MTFEIYQLSWSWHAWASWTSLSHGNPLCCVVNQESFWILITSQHGRDLCVMGEHFYVVTHASQWLNLSDNPTIWLVYDCIVILARTCLVNVIYFGTRNTIIWYFFGSEFSCNYIFFCLVRQQRWRRRRWRHLYQFAIHYRRCTFRSIDVIRSRFCSSYLTWAITQNSIRMS